jgi:predicted transcriptional regulator
MKAITIKSLETKTHPETKKLFWFVFVATRGGINRIKIISHLRNMPSNTHQLANSLGLDYKLVQHHMKNLEQNNLVTKVGSNYGATYFPSVLFEDGEAVFDEIVAKLNKVSDKHNGGKHNENRI